MEHQQDEIYWAIQEVWKPLTYILPIDLAAMIWSEIVDETDIYDIALVEKLHLAQEIITERQNETVRFM